MQSAELKMDFMVRPWDTVIEISNQIPMESWMLVGGLMTQAHAMLAGYESRATYDIDVLIDVMANASNVSHVVKKLQQMGFELQEPGLRAVAEALSDPSDSSWLKLNSENRKAGQMTLRILSS